MFRCKDCGQEYEIKPDYCDCGNDIFEDMTPAPEPAPKPQVALAPKPDRQTVFNEEIARNAKTVEAKSKIKVDFMSLLIFLICIVLSVLSLIYIGKDSLDKMAQEKNQPKDAKTVLTPTTNLPSLNSFWNSTPPKATENTSARVEPETQTAQPPVSQPVVQPKPIAPAQNVQNIQNVQNVKKAQPVKTQSQPAQPKKVQSAAKTTAQTAKPAQKTQTQQSKPITQTQQTTQKPVQTAQKTTTSAQKPTQQTAAPAPQPVQTVSPAALKQEMDNYKVALGRKLSSGIDYRKIVGDGVCAVSFKIDTAGNLVNRKFVTQASDNDSLNNAVYKTIMNNPTYKSPPQGYKNETLTFTVSIYGGRFNVSLN